MREFQTAALSALVGSSLGLLVLWLWPSPLAVRPENGERGVRRKAALRRSKLFRLVEPAIRNIGYHLSNLGPRPLHAWVEARLTQAGRPWGLNASELFACSAIVSLFGGLTGALLCAGTDRASGAGAIVGGTLGMCIPLFRVDEMSKIRRMAISRLLPQAIDLIVMSMKAGLDFPGALRQAAGQLGARNPLGFEFNQLLYRLSLGWSRQDALDAFAARIPDSAVREFAASIAQAEKHGTPLARVLGRQAEMMRIRRSQAAEQAAARAAVLILGPLMLIFACVFIILLGPFVIRFLRGGLI
jgi:tight adherence protein C